MSEPPLVNAHTEQTEKDYTSFRVSATDDNPCDLFERIDFPVDEFFPPEKGDFLECGQDDPSEPRDDCNCGCK